MVFVVDSFRTALLDHRQVSVDANHSWRPVLEKLHGRVEAAPDVKKRCAQRPDRLIEFPNVLAVQPSERALPPATVDGIAILYMTTGAIDFKAMQGFGRSPLTLLIFGVLAGYYAAYAIGVLRRSSQQATPAPIPPAQGSASP